MPSSESAARSRKVHPHPDHVTDLTGSRTAPRAGPAGRGEPAPREARPDPTILVLMATVTVDDVQEALTNVIDPELGLDFVELGLIYSVEVEDSDVFVSFTLTSPGCPIGPQVAEQIEEFVGELDGVGGGAPEDDLHARLDPRHDERRGQVRAGLLTPSRSADNTSRIPRTGGGRLGGSDP